MMIDAAIRSRFISDLSPTVLRACRRWIGLVAIVTISGCAAQTPAPAPLPISDLCGHRLLFAEEFNDLSVSAWGGNNSRWIAHTPYNGDFGDAQFTDPQPGFPFQIDDGILRIEARKGSDEKWRSGLLSSTDPRGNGFALQYGYFEMRAKLPPGPGVWPAFWLLTNQTKASSDPSVEFDVIEYYGHSTDGYRSVVHVWYKEPGKSRGEGHTNQVAAGSLSADFHSYGVSVEPDWAIIYLDRKEVWRVKTPPEHRKPLELLVDLGLGSGWPIDKTPNPSFMYVDYVRAYQRVDADDNSDCHSTLQ